jgi:hypothetical protein
MTEISEQLLRVGDELQRAWNADHRRQQSTSFWQRRRLVLVVGLAFLAVGGGVALAAAVLKSTAEEEQGILKGHLLFEGAQPRCEALTATSFRCTLDESPSGMTFYREDPKGSTSVDGKTWTPAFDKFLGMKVPTVDSTRHVDGGCVSISADGRAWDCFLGQSAVDRGIIGAGYLGHYLPQPPTG